MGGLLVISVAETTSDEDDNGIKKVENNYRLEKKSPQINRDYPSM